MKRLAIIGAGDLGQQIAYHALTDGHYKPVGFFDDISTNIHSSNIINILGKINDIECIYKNGIFDLLMIGIGYKHLDLRANIYNKFKNIIPFGKIVHSSAYVDPSCLIGAGSFIYPGCILDMNVVLNSNVLLNVACVIAHDSNIGSHSFLSPAVKVAGFVNIAEKVSLGIGTVVIDNIKICNKVRTGAGAIVINNLTVPGLYVGVPAKFKKA